MKAIQSMGYNELIALRASINDLLMEKEESNKFNIFLDEQREIENFVKKEQEIAEKRKSFVKNSKITSKIEALGYTIVFYGKEKYSFLDFSKQKINNDYVGYNLKNDVLENPFDLEDYEALKKILGL